MFLRQGMMNRSLSFASFSALSHCTRRLASRPHLGGEDNAREEEQNPRECPDVGLHGLEKVD
jgi:hypothetical protein